MYLKNIGKQVLVMQSDIKLMVKIFNTTDIDWMGDEIIDVNLDEYDGPFKESKYGLDGLTKKSNIDDALYLTRNMICYWK